jgi:uncharacterized repeat protein (TIGR02543 family)
MQSSPVVFVDARRDIEKKPAHGGNEMSRRDLALRALAAGIVVSAAACGGDDKAAGPDTALNYGTQPDAGVPDWTGSVGPVDISIWGDQPGNQPPLSLDGTDPSDGVVWEPISVADMRAQRASFHWEDTEALSEESTVTFDRSLFTNLEPEEQQALDSVDLPAIALPPMRYAQIYVKNADQLRELEEMGVHYATTPLFDEEWPTGDQSLTIPSSGDPDDAGATFVFALIPTPVYNGIRAEALAGEDTYDALILRDIPARARAADGTVDWSFLIANLESYAPISTELTDEGEVTVPLEDEAVTDAAAAAAEQKRLGRRLRKALRKVVKAVRGVVDGVRQVIGVAANVFLKSKTIHIKASVSDRSRAPLVRAWKDGTTDGYGKRLALKGLRVNVSGRSFLALHRAKLDANGEADVKVPKNIHVHVCFEADSPTAVFETGVLVPTLHCWNNRDPEQADDFVGAVGDTEFYSMAQMIDARDFASTVLGFTPPKAHVQVGWLGEVLTKDTNAFVPCLAATGAPVTMANAYVDALNLAGGVAGGLVLGTPIPLGSIVEFGLATDIVIGDEARHSRNTSVHEYGHFFFCSLLAKTNPQAYNLVWSQVLSLNNLAKDASTPVKALNEGFADWFASQAVGSVNYFWPTDAVYEEGPGGHGFLSMGGPGNGNGLEMNFGGPACDPATGPKGCDALSAGYEPTAGVIAKVVSILHDTIDRGECKADEADCSTATRNDGSPWSTTEPGRFTLQSPATLEDIEDENVKLTARDIKETIEDFARENLVAAALTYDNFYSALTSKMSQRGATDLEICQLFALHETDGVCDYGLPGTAPAPFTPGAVTPVPTPDPVVPVTPVTPDPVVPVTPVTPDPVVPVTPDPVVPVPVTPAPVTIFIVPVTGGTVSFGGAAPGGACGATECQYTPGSVATLTAVTQPGYVFTGWSACSDSTSPVLSLTVSTQSQTCAANFVAEPPVVVAPATYNVSATPTAGGVVTPGNTTVTSGGSVTLVASASPGYRFTGYTGSAQCVGADPQLVISGISADVACTANFVRTLRVTYALNENQYRFNTTATVSPTGALCADGVCNVDGGQSVTILSVATDPIATLLNWECREAGTGVVLNSETTPTPETITLNNLQNDWTCTASTWLTVI